MVTKEQKRKWKLERRIKCHGNNNSCIREHPATISKIPIKKEGWWSRLIDKIKKWFTK